MWSVEANAIAVLQRHATVDLREPRTRRAPRTIKDNSKAQITASAAVSFHVSGAATSSESRMVKYPSPVPMVMVANASPHPSISHPSARLISLYRRSRPNALVQLQAQYNHCGAAASEKCLSAATFVRPRVEMGQGRTHGPLRRSPDQTAQWLRLRQETAMHPASPAFDRSLLA